MSSPLPLHPTRWFDFSKRLASIAVCGVALAVAQVSQATVTLAPLFRDGAVLQRDAALPVWGRAQPGEAIEVMFKGASRKTVADADGRWTITLPPQKVSTEPAELVVIGRVAVRVRNVLIGDLWLCSGQSNMGFVVSRGLNAEKEIAEANFPLIRCFEVPQVPAVEPVDTSKGKWVRCSPETAGDFPGAAFFFAREMFQHHGVPIGLLHASWGGTQIESWMRADALAADPAWATIQAAWRKRLADYPRKLENAKMATARWEAASKEASAAGRPFTDPKPAAAEGPGSRWMPASLYNGMIAPFAPAALRGVLWYQGEANAPRASEYASLFRGLIQQWRAAFGQGDLPFYFVQLANFNRESDATRTTWAHLREAQAEALALPKTAMVVAIDIGEVNDVHPRNKQEVGRRFALIARYQLEGDAVDCSGPVFKAAVREGAALRVSFVHGEGLHSRAQPIVGVEIAGADRRFHPATVRIDGETLVVSSEKVSEPGAVRYAWHNFPEACLFGRSGLPAAPFRSERW
ncbi:MAG: sialate O-acetylesterase [Acidobacteria bacterium]|nr:sialate O-acetylesterase [Acidobacteriota bacterium]